MIWAIAAAENAMEVSRVTRGRKVMAGEAPIVRFRPAGDDAMKLGDAIVADLARQPFEQMVAHQRVIPMGPPAGAASAP